MGIRFPLFQGFRCVVCLSSSSSSSFLSRFFVSTPFLARRSHSLSSPHLFSCWVSERRRDLWIKSRIFILFSSKFLTVSSFLWMKKLKKMTEKFACHRLSFSLLPLHELPFFWAKRKKKCKKYYRRKRGRKLFTSLLGISSEGDL